MENQFLPRMIAADETWCHHFDSAIKCMSMEWQNPSSPLLLEWLPASSTVNAAMNCATLHELRKNIKIHRRGILSRGAIILHDNARPHIAVACQTLLRQFPWLSSRTSLLQSEHLAV
ncbi:histone-lysine N-methyltransferase SETMAR [Nephila pilipes]|uniref:Histone-lysine N-methyltransferase SETMAR n=1 Tax=Nephila pilipes TaxID=299642 RepID=A0A8X6UK63_NEPPI|nr:histone-lysine N-methyltransferase SETMAR [Nephila pilipes]